MKLPLTLLLAALLAAPAVSAGGVDANVDYLEADESCDSSSTYDSDSAGYSDPNGTYSSSWSYETSADRAGCHEEFTTAGASATVDDEDVAGARVGGSDSSDGSRDRTTNSSSYRDSRYGNYSSSTYDGSGAWSFADHESRSVEAHALGEEADVTNACESTRDRSYSYSGAHSSSDSHRNGHWSNTESGTYGDSCWEGASVDTAGREAQAGRDSGCSSTYAEDYDYDWYSSQYGNESYYSTYEGRSSRDDHACHDVVTAGSGDASVAAGSRSACSYSSRSMEEEYGSSSENETYTYGYNSSQSDCKSGFVVEGPDGIELFVGGEEEAWSDCSNDYCSGDEWRQNYAQLSWEHSPLGDNAYRVHIPLLA